MIYNEKQAGQALEKNTPVFMLYSMDALALREHAGQIVHALGRDDPEMTQLPGPTPSVEEVILAAGTISFFGTRRLVVMQQVQASTYNDKDLDDLCEAFRQADNAVFVLTCLCEEYFGKLRLDKNTKKLVTACEEIGYCAEVPKPGKADLMRRMETRATDQGATIGRGAQQALLECCGEDGTLLDNEIDKLAAASGYNEITPALVAQMGTRSLDADAFEMIARLNSNSPVAALDKLRVLLEMQNDPNMIGGALISSFLDMYRVKLGDRQRRMPADVKKDFKYGGSDYRLRKAADAARPYTREQLRECLDVLATLDKGLKGGKVDDEVLLQTTLCKLAELRRQ